MDRLWKRFTLVSIMQKLRIVKGAFIACDAGGRILASTANSLTATAGGGQTNALPLTSMFNRVTTVATAGDSVKLPASTALNIGDEITVTNTAANGVDIFPATGDQINAQGANVAFRLGQNMQVQFRLHAAGVWTTIIPFRDSKFTTAALSGSTAAAGQLTGARTVVMNNSGANPGTYTTRTGAQMVADGNYQVGDSYLLRIVNGQGTGTLTLAAGDANVTLTGTMTVAVNSFRDFVVTITGTNTLTIQSVATGTWS